MSKNSSNSPRYSREEFVELLDSQLGRLETEQVAQNQYGKLLQVMRRQLAVYAKGAGPKDSPKKPTSR